MPSPGLFLLPLAFAHAQSSATAAIAPRAARDTGDTARPAVVPRAGTDAVPAPATLTFDLGGGAGTPIGVRSIEVGLTDAGPAAAPGRGATHDARDAAGAGARAVTTRVTVVRTPDTLSAGLARRVRSGEAIPVIDARLPGGAGAPALVVHLRDVRVVSSRLVMAGDTLPLVQQRLALDESIAQLAAELAEVTRQYGVAASLEKQRLSPSLEVARVRGNMELLTTRLAMQRERRAMVERQLARWVPVHEELVFEAGGAAVEAVQP